MRQGTKRGTRARPHPRCLIMAHGAGSTADFLGRAFPAGVCASSTRYIEERTGSAARTAELILAEAQRMRPESGRVFIGGVSIGAHAAALVASQCPPGLIDGCILAMPGWLGAPDRLGPTGLAAQEVGRLGAASALERLRCDPLLRDDWVVAELDLAWRDRPTLAGELQTAAAEPAPDEDALRGVRVPALVLGLQDDPMHPLTVARSWSALIPDCAVTLIPRSAAAGDRSVFGAAARLWLDAVAPTEPR